MEAAGTSKSSTTQPGPTRHFGSSTTGNTYIVANSSSCSNFGNLATYQHNVPLVSRYGGKASTGVFLPVYASRSLAATNIQIKTVLIMIHGLLRNANDVFCDAINGLPSNKKNEILVIAPWFSDTSFNGSQWNSQIQSIWGQASVSAYWNTSSWMDGGDNTPGNGVPGDFTSSFDALDTLITGVKQQGLFPNLQLITVTGFSAGGQMINRFSWATEIDSQTSTAARNRRNKMLGLRLEAFVPVRYIVSDASSYLYLSPQRPIASCLPLYNNGYGSNVTCNKFTIPANVSATCKGYDEWKFGLSLTPPPKAHRYLEAITKEPGGVTNRTRAFFKKDVRLILGGQDVCNCNVKGFVNDPTCYIPNVTCSPSKYSGPTCCDTYPDAVSNDIANGYESLLQGYDRLQRGMIYFAFLAWLQKGYTAVYAIVPTMKHNSAQYLSSSAFQAWAY